MINLEDIEEVVEAIKDKEDQPSISPLLNVITFMILDIFSTNVEKQTRANYVETSEGVLLMAYVDMKKPSNEET